MNEYIQLLVIERILMMTRLECLLVSLQP